MPTRSIFFCERKKEKKSRRVKRKKKTYSFAACGAYVRAREEREPRFWLIAEGKEKGRGGREITCEEKTRRENVQGAIGRRRKRGPDPRPWGGRKSKKGKRGRRKRPEKKKKNSLLFESSSATEKKGKKRSWVLCLGGGGGVREKGGMEGGTELCPSPVQRIYMAPPGGEGGEEIRP